MATYRAKPPKGALLNRADPLANGLAGAWLLNEGSGLTAYDSAGASHGALTSGPTWTTGPHGKCVSFDGSNDYIAVGSPAALKLGASFTLAAWIRLSSNGSYPGIIGWTFAATFGGGVWLLYLNAASREVGVVSGGTQIASTLVVTVGQWAFVAATRTSAGTRLYLNNSSQAGSGAGLAPASNPGNLNYASGSVGIGTFSAGSPTSFPFPGQIGFACAINRALSQREMGYLRDDSFRMFRRRSVPVPVRPTGGGVLVLAGSTSITFTTSGNATGGGVAVGSSSITFATTGAATANGVAAGASSLTFTTTGAATADGVAAGLTSFAFAASGSAGANGVLSSSATITISSEGTLAANGAAIGSAAITFTSAGAATADGVCIGSTSITFVAAIANDDEAPVLASLRGCLNVSAAMAGGVELAPSLRASFVVAPTFSGAVEIGVMNCEGELSYGALLLKNTTDVKIIGLKLDGEFVNDADCVMTLFEVDEDGEQGDPVTGAVSLSLDFNVTDGEYLGRLPNTLALTRDAQYQLEASATKAGVAVGTWTADLVASVRSASHCS